MHGYNIRKKNSPFLSLKLKYEKKGGQESRTFISQIKNQLYIIIHRIQRTETITAV